MRIGYTLALGGVIGGVIVGAGVLAIRGNITVEIKGRPKTPSVQHESAVTPTTIIERQIVVREPAIVPSAESTVEGSQTAQRTAEPVNVAADMESMFQNDRGPTESAREAERALQSAFASRELQGVHLDHFECRAVTCRVEVTFDNTDADRKALFRLFGPESELSKLGKAVTVPVRNTTRDGKIAATMYLYPPPPPQSAENPT